MIRKTLLTLIALICTSCVHINEGKVDLIALKNNPDKFGITALRAIYVKDDKIVDAFANDHALPEQGLRAAYIYAKNSAIAAENDKKEEYLISTTSYGQEEASHEKLFITTSLNEKNEKITITNPNYFYAVKMLPQGHYYISTIRIYHRGSSYLYQSFDNLNSPINFSVRANEINYLGDLFFSGRKKVSHVLTAYKVKINLFDKAAEAQSFIRHYRPEINLRFESNLMHNKASDITLDYVDIMNGGLLGGMLSAAIGDAFE